MPECPACLGEGEIDNSDLAAQLQEHFPDAVVVSGVYECPECAGEGEITEGHRADLEAWAVARVDQFLAAEREKERSM